MKSKTWRDYQCQSCAVTRKVKRYIFSSDGFLRECNLCETCAEQHGVLEMAQEYLRKQKELKYENVSK